MAVQIQSGVIAPASRDALFLTFNQTDAPEALDKIRQVLASVPDLQQQFNAQYPEAELHLVAAVGAAFWPQLITAHSPAQLRSFPALEQGERLAPSTPVDLLFHIRSDRHDLNFQLAWQLREQLQGAAELQEEVHGFRYMDSRDMTGFVDGTENPEGDDRAAVALVGPEDPVFEGGSYIHLQKYIHRMPLWNRQSLKTQEDTIGRTKTDNVEYAGADKAATAHTRRTSLKDAQGQSIEILRHSMPWGNSQQCGLLFASYCRTPENFELMLRSMVDGDEHGHWDHLLRYTRAVTGQAFFAPSLEYLRTLA